MNASRPKPSGDLAALVPVGAVVTLKRDPVLDNKDRYGRLLRYVYYAGENLNLELVREGAAAPYFYFGDRGRYASRLVRLAKSAKAGHVGLWGACRDTALDPYHQVAAIKAAPPPPPAPTSGGGSGGSGGSGGTGSSGGGSSSNCTPGYSPCLRLPRRSGLRLRGAAAATARTTPRTEPATALPGRTSTASTLTVTDTGASSNANTSSALNHLIGCACGSTYSQPRPSLSESSR